MTNVTDITERLNAMAPGLVKMLDERHDLLLDLYRLALKEHVKNGRSCDQDIECQECTLLLIASEELDEPEPFPNNDPLVGLGS